MKTSSAHRTNLYEAGCFLPKIESKTRMYALTLEFILRLEVYIVQSEKKK